MFFSAATLVGGIGRDFVYKGGNQEHISFITIMYCFTEFEW